MPIQSYLMMYFAGSAWQFGKRKISAKSNEEFNKLTMKTLLEEHTMELKSVIPTLEKSLNDITPLIAVLIEQYGDFIKEALKAVPQALLNVIGQGGGEFSNIPTTGATGLPPAQMASFLHFFKELSDKTKGEGTFSGNTGLQEFENTEAKRIALQKEFNIQFERDKKILAAKVRAEARKDIRDITPQLSQGQQSRLIQNRKRKAGQSQILGKKSFLNNIKLMEARRRQLITRKQTGSVVYRRNNDALRRQKQLLANLQARYQF